LIGLVYRQKEMNYLEVLNLINVGKVGFLLKYKKSLFFKTYDWTKFLFSVLE